MEGWWCYSWRWIISMAIIKMNSIGIDKDKFGVKLKFPNRECKQCQRYPCFTGIDKCYSNFASCGCFLYKS